MTTDKGNGNPCAGLAFGQESTEEELYVGDSGVAASLHASYKASQHRPWMLMPLLWILVESRDRGNVNHNVGSEFPQSWYVTCRGSDFWLLSSLLFENDDRRRQATSC